MPASGACHVQPRVPALLGCDHEGRQLPEPACRRVHSGDLVSGGLGVAAEWGLEECLSHGFSPSSSSLLPPRRVDEDMFPHLLPPTEQDLTKLLLEGQGESGGGSLGAQPLLQPSSYGQSGISMSHLDLRANPSW